MAYKVKLEVFEGPLDLLLYLIKREQLNIYDIPIAKLTQEYLDYLEIMRMLDLDIAGEFVVMAATLIHIKSKMLLPPEEREPEEVEEEDPREELIRRLLEYKRFKEAAGQLQGMESRRFEFFGRSGQPELVDEEGNKYFEANLFDLLTAFSKVLKSVSKEKFQEIVKDKFTVEDKMHDIFHMLVEKPTISFTELFEAAQSKIEIVVIFLALLELIRLKEIIVRQQELFSDIQIMRNTNKIRSGMRRAKVMDEQDTGGTDK